MNPVVVARLGLYSVTDVLFQSIILRRLFLRQPTIAAAQLPHSLMLMVVISRRDVVFAVFVRAPVVL